ncbi:acyltransferase [Akkermansiaceae bacterium]|nr:acyltransferase [Akkermansiaceae bacterium]
MSFFAKVFYSLPKITDKIIKPFLRFYLSSQNVALASFPKISGKPLIINLGKIRMGKNVIITSRLSGNPIGGKNKTCLFTTKCGNILIEDNVALSNVVIYSSECIKIERDVLVGGGTQIFDTDFHSLKFDDRIIDRDPNIKKSPVLIEKGAFIGANCLILKGVTIGSKSVIGAGSVVTKSVPENQIWAGNPAKFINNIE